MLKLKDPYKQPLAHSLAHLVAAMADLAGVATLAQRALVHRRTRTPKPL